MMRRLKYWLTSGRRSESLSEEMRLHLEETAAGLEADGMTPEQARLEARRRFGNVGLIQEDSREIWMTRFLSELGQDLRYGLRTMAANKVFSALAVMSLALGIGANTAIYSFMEAILLRSLPVTEPESLVVLNWRSRLPQEASKKWVHVVHSIDGMFWPGQKGYLETGIFPYSAFEMFRKESPVFSTVFAYYDGRSHNLSVGGQAISTRTEFVSGEYFNGLGVTAAAGRLIASDDDRVGAAAVAVISYAASQRRFGSAANAIGQSVLVDSIPFTVVGVTPPGFFGVDPASPLDLYLPLRTNLLVDGADAQRAYTDQNHYWLEMMGRLRPGVTVAQAQAVLGPRFRDWVTTTATSDGERAKLPTFVAAPGAAGLGGLRREYAKPLYVLLAMVGLILALTCTNIANLLLARATARRREMAVRLSLGAGRLRVIRQLLTESVMLSALGGALGIVFAVWGVQALTYLFSRGRENFTLYAELNWNVLAVTAVLSVACGLLFGLVPALQSTRLNLTPTLKTAAARPRAQQVLVVAQIAMSFLILFSAGLFARTLDKLHAVQLGYSRDNILLFSLNARQAGHRDPEITTFYANLRKRFEAIPGVTSASLSHASIISAGHAGKTIRSGLKIGAVSIDGANVLVAGPSYLATMQIPLLAGREFDERDQASSLPVAMISERVARTYFGSENPIGRRITVPEEKRDFEIVGVTANVRVGSLKSGNPTTIFVPSTQIPPEGMTYALRTSGDPLQYVRQVREIVRDTDSAIAVTDVVTQAGEIDRTISREITFARLCTGFALLALLTAGIGLYGTMSYTVTRQSGEIGIRMALGAQRGAMVWMVLRRVLVLLAIGLAISVPAAFGLARLVRSMLFGTQAFDPLVLAVTATVLLATAVLAGYAPARRASRVDPMIALRQE